MKYLYLGIILLLGFLLIVWVNRKYLWKQPKIKQLNASQRDILKTTVVFYNKLIDSKKTLFEFKVLEFLENIRITGVKTDVSEKDRLLVAASAIIPIMAFPKWSYRNLNEVLLYPDTFGENYQLEGKNRNILGMVGEGNLERKMILSKKALYQGFKNEKDKRNTAIHEFIHLIDKADGVVDGIPSVLMNKQYVIPWLNLIDQKIIEIHKGKSDINPYGGTSQIEFFAVLGEYFFEHPEQLKKKHPRLYETLDLIFNPK